MKKIISKSGLFNTFSDFNYLKTNISGLEEDTKNGKEMTYDQLDIIYQELLIITFSTVPGMV